MITIILGIILAIGISLLSTKIYRQSKNIELLKSKNKSLKNYVEFLITPVIGVRRSGNTTRLADSYIQKLFNEKQIAVKDHYNTHESNDRLFKIILKRLEIEHPHVKIKIHKGFKKIDLA